MAVPIDEMPIPSAPADPAPDPDAPSDSDPALEIDADALLEAEGRAYAEGLAFPTEADVVSEPSSEEPPDLARQSLAEATPDPVPDSDPSTPVFEIDADARADAGIEAEEATEEISDPVSLSADELVESAIEQDALLDPPSEPDASRQSPEEATPDPDSDEPSQGLPLPTMTLARLALDQGDLELAERTLHGVLERDPSHAEAAELLAALAAGDGGGNAVETEADDSGDARVRALRRWLAAVRLASERLQT